MKQPNLLDCIGNTPLVRLRHMPGRGVAEVWAKLEGENPGGSVKDRVALSVIERAEAEGDLLPGGTVVEPTSGNTGIGLAMVCAVKGYRLILTMPESASKERRGILKAYGAEIVLTPAAKGMLGAIAEADSIVAESQGRFKPDQFGNPANPEAHRQTTALEIVDQMGGVPDAFVTGVGTGGTITGVGEVFRAQRPDVRIVAVEPSGSPMLSGGSPGKHRIAGIGAGFFSQVLNLDIFDDVVTVRDEDAEETARRLATEEGILAGISSGAAAWAAIAVAKPLGAGRKIAVILPDRGERYLSTGAFEEKETACGTGCI